VRVLGIDPGSETTGWGVVEGDARSYRLVEFGVLKLKTTTTHSSRLFKIFNGLEEIVERLKPDACAIEEAFYAVNPKVILKLGQVRGVALLIAERAALEIGEYAPRLVKQTVAGYGNADKRQEPHDAADALAVAICHFHHAGVRERLQAAEARMKTYPTVAARRRG